MKIRMCAARSLAVWTLAAAASAAAMAQTSNFPPPQNVLQLSASGQVEVQQDLLSLSLTSTREGTTLTRYRAAMPPWQKRARWRSLDMCAATSVCIHAMAGTARSAAGI